jgi:hypothetical protein
LFDLSQGIGLIGSFGQRLSQQQILCFSTVDSVGDNTLDQGHQGKVFNGNGVFFEFTRGLQMFERVKKFTRDVDGVFKSIVMISIGMDKKQRILGSQRNVWTNQRHSMGAFFFYNTQVHLFVQRCIIDNVFV